MIQLPCSIHTGGLLQSTVYGEDLPRRAVMSHPKMTSRRIIWRRTFSMRSDLETSCLNKKVVKPVAGFELFSKDACHTLAPDTSCRERRDQSSFSSWLMPSTAPVSDGSRFRGGRWQRQVVGKSLCQKN